MTNEEREVLVDGFIDLAKKLSVMAGKLAKDAPTASAPEKTYTYKEVRAILAEKSRTGFRAEVKAILTAHGIQQLSDVKDQETFAAIVKEAEEIGNG